MVIGLASCAFLLLAPAPPADDALLDRAKKLLDAAPFIDTHNDLPTMLVAAPRSGDLSKLDLGKPQPDLCADVPRLREGHVGVQYWSIWVESRTMRSHTALHEAIREFDVALRFIHSRPELELAKTADDIERIHRSGRIASLFGVEGGHMIENSLAALRVFYELGARYMTLTHWDTVDWADAATDREDHDGLTRFGEKVVREMNRLGMFVDISHVSANTMRDVLRVSRAPVIFSHSDSYAMNPHPRNAPDDVLKLLAANGGVIHVNFIREFVAPGSVDWDAKRKEAVRGLRARYEDAAALEKATNEWKEKNPAPTGSIAQVADIIDHIKSVAGIDHIGIGADFYDDGKASMVPGLENVTRYPYLFAELLRRGYSDEDILKIAGRNHLRAMHQMEAVAKELQKTENPFIGEGVETH